MAHPFVPISSLIGVYEDYLPTCLAHPGTMTCSIPFCLLRRTVWKLLYAFRMPEQTKPDLVSSWVGNCHCHWLRLVTHNKESSALIQLKQMSFGLWCLLRDEDATWFWSFGTSTLSCALDCLRFVRLTAVIWCNHWLLVVKSTAACRKTYLDSVIINTRPTDCAEIGVEPYKDHIHW